MLSRKILHIGPPKSGTTSLQQYICGVLSKDYISSKSTHYWEFNSCNVSFLSNEDFYGYPFHEADMLNENLFNTIEYFQPTEIIITYRKHDEMIMSLFLHFVINKLSKMKNFFAEKIFLNTTIYYLGRR